MSVVTVRRGWAFGESDRDRLVAAFHEEDDSLEVGFEGADEEDGFPAAPTGVEPVFVLNLVLDHTADAVISAVLTGAITWARSRLRRRPDRHVEVNLYGPDGEILRRVRVTDPDEEPEELDEAE